MITLKQITDIGTTQLTNAGYVVAVPGSRLNGDGSIGLLYRMTKGGKNYQLVTRVVLVTETEASLAVYPNIFKAEMANIVELS